MNCKKITSLLLTTTIMSQSILPSVAMETREIAQQHQETRYAQNALSEFTTLDLHHLFKGCEELSLLNGVLFTKSGVLRKLRFEGLYDEPKRILTHYAIAHPAHHASTAATDSPQDSTSALIQQLFPSPAADHLAIPGAVGDFFKVMPIEKIAELLVLYHNEKNHLRDLGKINPGAFENFFSYCFGNTKIPLAKNAVKWSMNKSRRKELKRLWKKDFESLSKNYASIFTNALLEYDNYPVNTVESAMLAFIWKRMTRNNDDPGALARVMSILQPGIPIELPQSTRFTKEYYEAWKKEACEESGHLKPKAFEKLLNDPESLTALTLFYEVYGYSFPTILGTSEAIHTYIDEGNEHKIKFANCGETMLRNFFNIIFADRKTRTFVLSEFKKIFPNASPKLIAFYEGNSSNSDQFFQPTFESVNEGISGHSAWADVVSSLNTQNDEQKIHYREKGRCNIAGDGLDNMLPVIEKLLGDRFIANEENRLDEDQYRAQRLTYILTKLSQVLCPEASEDFSDSDSADSYSYSNSSDGPRLTWHIEQDNSALSNFVVVSIRLDNEDLFDWVFRDHHFQIKRSALNANLDWRSLLPEDQKKFLKSDLPQPLKAHLAPFFLLKDCVDVAEDEDSYDENYSDENLQELVELASSKGLLNELLFGAPIEGSEVKLDIINDLIPYQNDITKQLFPLWLKKLPEDKAIDTMVATLIYKHRSFFTEDLLDQAGTRVKGVYQNLLNTFQDGMTAKDFDLYLESEWCEPFIKDYLYHGNIEPLLSSETKYGEIAPQLLIQRFSDQEEFLPFFKTFMSRGADMIKIARFIQPFLSANQKLLKELPLEFFLIQIGQVHDTKMMVDVWINRHEEIISNPNALDAFRHAFSYYEFYIELAKHAPELLPSETIFKENLVITEDFLDRCAVLKGTTYSSVSWKMEGTMILKTLMKQYPCFVAPFLNHIALKRNHIEGGLSRFIRSMMHEDPEFLSAQPVLSVLTDDVIMKFLSEKISPKFYEFKSYDVDFLDESKELRQAFANYIRQPDRKDAFFETQLNGIEYTSSYSLGKYPAFLTTLLFEGEEIFQYLVNKLLANDHPCSIDEFLENSPVARINFCSRLNDTHRQNILSGYIQTNNIYNMKVAPTLRDILFATAGPLHVNIGTQNELENLCTLFEQYPVSQKIIQTTCSLEDRGAYEAMLRKYMGT